MYDAIVVGARCAGAPTALLLARRGYRVLLLDKAAFPSETLSTHFVRYAGIRCLERWGVLDRVLATGCPPVHRWTIHMGDFPLSGCPPLPAGLISGCGPRRTVLDTLLVAAAAEAGAEVREGVVVQDLTWEEGRVTGIRGRSRAGTPVVERARLVIGADGMRSRVAQCARAPAYHVVPSQSCAYYTYWADVPLDGLEAYNLGPQRRAIVAFPTNDGLVCTYLGWPRTDFDAIRRDLEGSVYAALALAPGLGERIRGGQRAERIRGTGDLPSFVRRPYGPGWALVGDAGCHCDPINATGIRDAFLSVELLVEAIAAGFAGQRPLEEALADYERRRNALLLPGYADTCRDAALAPGRIPAEQLRLRVALRADQEATNWYIGGGAQTITPEEFAAADAVRPLLSRLDSG